MSIIEKIVKTGNVDKDDVSKIFRKEDINCEEFIAIIKMIVIDKIFNKEEVVEFLLKYNINCKQFQCIFRCETSNIKEFVNSIKCKFCKNPSVLSMCKDCYCRKCYRCGVKDQIKTICIGCQSSVCDKCLSKNCDKCGRKICLRCAKKSICNKCFYN